MALIAVDVNSQLLLVQPTKRSNWVLPQGGIEPGHSLLQALEISLKEKLGLVYTPAMLCQMRAEEHLAVLGTYSTEAVKRRLPEEVVVVAMRLTCPRKIRKDIRRVFVGNRMALSDLLECPSTIASRAVEEAVHLTYLQGLIDWSCEKSVVQEPARALAMA